MVNKDQNVLGLVSGSEYDHLRAIKLATLTERLEINQTRRYFNRFKSFNSSVQAKTNGLLAIVRLKKKRKVVKVLKYMVKMRKKS